VGNLAKDEEIFKIDAYIFQVYQVFEDKIMKTFVQWADTKQLELPYGVETEPTEPATSENSVRTGQTHNYPDAYLRSQYPLAWLTPTKATAYLDAAQKARPKLPDQAAK
jgi:hypothetical protein